MPALLVALLAYRRHRASGQPTVTLSGQTFSLGPHGTQVGRREYDRVVAEWLENGRRLPAATAAAPLSVVESIAAYRRHCKRYYRKTDGTPTSQLNLVRSALRPLKTLYGSTAAADFGPLALRVVRQQLIIKGMSRGTVNDHVSRIKCVFRWAGVGVVLAAAAGDVLLLPSR